MPKGFSHKQSIWQGQDSVVRENAAFLRCPLRVDSEDHQSFRNLRFSCIKRKFAPVPNGPCAVGPHGVI